MINLFATLRFNIKAFGWRTGLRFPVVIHGDFKAYNVGTIRLTCEPRRGLIVIGLNQCDTVVRHSVWNNQGTIEIGGPLYINFGTRIKNQGTITFSGNDILSQECMVDIRSTLHMGKNVSVGYNSEIVDSDIHFSVDVENHCIRYNTVPIRIGNFNWFGSHTFIKKGTITPDYLTVASPNALLCKDYSDLPPHAILGGAPANMIKQGTRRLFNFANEVSVRQWFAQHPDQSVYPLSEDVPLDDFCALF